MIPAHMEPRRDTRKKDKAPRGVYRHPSGAWAARYSCGQGHVHKERVGPSKDLAVKVYHARRAKVYESAAWCPRVERLQAQGLAQAARARQITFKLYVESDYLPWAKLHHRGYETEAGRVKAMVAAFGDVRLDALSSADVEKFLDGLLATRSQATRNRYRTVLHAILNRARRHGRMTVNPVQDVGKYREPEGRTQFLLAEEEAAVWEALRADLRPLFVVSINTGLRWSEQNALRWDDVDFATGLLTVRQSKSGYSRRVPMNSTVRTVLTDLAKQRVTPNDANEPVFKRAYVQAAKFFPRAVAQAQRALIAAGKDGKRLNGYSWHCNRHTFASRLAMAGVDTRSIQTLGGWRTLGMVERYSHLAPQHLQDAVERLVPGQLARNLPDVLITSPSAS